MKIKLSILNISSWLYLLYALYNLYIYFEFQGWLMWNPSDWLTAMLLPLISLLWLLTDFILQKNN